MERIKNTFFIFRFALSLAIVATTMAVACPEPGVIDPPEPVPVTKSAERESFESAYGEGLYLKGSCVLSYNSSSFQRAINPARRNYRIQSDDQTRYLNVSYNYAVPVNQGVEVECEVHYRLEAGESTTLIVKFVVVKTAEDDLWLWNEFQKVGAIVRKI